MRTRQWKKERVHAYVCARKRAHEFIFIFQSFTYLMGIIRNHLLYHIERWCQWYMRELMSNFIVIFVNKFCDMKPSIWTFNGGLKKINGMKLESEEELMHSLASHQSQEPRKMPLIGSFWIFFALISVQSRSLYSLNRSIWSCCWFFFSEIWTCIEDIFKWHRSGLLFFFGKEEIQSYKTIVIMQMFMHTMIFHVKQLSLCSYLVSFIFSLLFSVAFGA